MATTIRNVPDELLVEILGKLPKKDLKKARLACRLWSTTGAKWMFQRVYFAPRKASMKTFTDIATNPDFARNIKELIYDGRLFLPELETFASYWTAFSARMGEECDIYEESETEFADEVYQGSVWNMENLGAGDNMKRVIAGDCREFYMNVVNSLVRYARLLDQQESIFKKARDFKALCEGLKSFRNISKVGAFAEFSHSSDYDLRAGVKHDDYIVCHDWYGSRSKFEFGLTVPPSGWCHRASQSGGQQVQEEHTRWDVRGVQSLFRAISTHCSSLKELSIASMDYKAPMTIFQLSDTDIEKVRPMFRCLTTLQIHPYVTKSDDGPEYAKQHRCLEILLQEATELRILSSSRRFLYKKSHWNEDLVLSERTDFGMFLGKSWPHLTQLMLSTASVKAEDLMSIVRAHRGSLRYLHLRCISLLGKEGWEHFGKEMGQILRLHFFWVYGLSDDVTDHSRPWGRRSLTFVRDMMQWALPDLVEIKEDDGMMIGRLKAGLS